MKVLELLPTYLENNDFIGYEDVLLTHDQLKRIISTNNMSWKATLSNIKGIYLQHDSIIIQREYRWMEALGTNKHGYNN